MWTWKDWKDSYSLIKENRAKVLLLCWFLLQYLNSELNVQLNVHNLVKCQSQLSTSESMSAAMTKFYIARTIVSWFALKSKFFVYIYLFCWEYYTIFYHLSKHHFVYFSVFLTVVLTSSRVELDAIVLSSLTAHPSLELPWSFATSVHLIIMYSKEKSRLKIASCFNTVENNTLLTETPIVLVHVLNPTSMLLSRSS